MAAMLNVTLTLTATMTAPEERLKETDAEEAARDRDTELAVSVLRVRSLCC
jgi:hypothetical protein